MVSFKAFIRNSLNSTTHLNTSQLNTSQFSIIENFSTKYDGLASHGHFGLVQTTLSVLEPPVMKRNGKFSFVILFVLFSSDKNIGGGKELDKQWHS